MAKTLTSDPMLEKFMEQDLTPVQQTLPLRFLGFTVIGWRINPKIELAKE
jgi:hypothetical protein